MSIIIKQGDTRHAIQAVLRSVAGQPIDLSAAQVRFIMRSQRGVTRVDRQAQQTTEAGQVWVVFQDGDTDVSDFYKAEFHVKYSDGKTETFPHSGTIAITIEPNLGGIT